MSTQISKSLIALFFLGMFVTGCNTNIKQTADNDIKFDSIRIRPIICWIILIIPIVTCN